MPAPVILFSCPKCAQAFSAPPEAAGMEVACPNCEETVVVPVVLPSRNPLLLPFLTVCLLLAGVVVGFIINHQGRDDAPGVETTADAVVPESPETQVSLEDVTPALAPNDTFVESVEFKPTLTVETVRPRPEAGLKPSEYGERIGVISRIPSPVSTPAPEADPVQIAQSLAKQRIAQLAKELARLEEERAQLAKKRERLGEARGGKRVAVPRGTERHWIKRVLGDGTVLEMDDGSLWEVDSVDTVYTSLWLPFTDVILVDAEKLFNIDYDETVHVRPR